MRLRKLAHILSTLLLVICYATTIPVLSVFHDHYARTHSSASSIEAAKKLSDPNTDPLFCAVCFRVSTTHAFIHDQTNAAIAAVHHPAFVPDIPLLVDLVGQQPFHGRAPPPKRA